jgi:uncharacterized membrane protein
MSSNPYEAPKTEATEATVAQGNFIPGGRGVGIGRGWDWIASAWALFMRQPGIWIVLTIIGIVLFIVMMVIPFVGPLALALLAPVLAAGLLLGCRTLEGGGPLEVGHLFAGFRSNVGSLIGVAALNLVAQIGIALVTGLISGAGLYSVMSNGGDPTAIMTGVPITVVLGVLVGLALAIPVAMAVWFAAALIALNDRNTIDAMKESFFGCLKNILPFLLYGIVMFVLVILACLPFFLGWLVVGPVLFASIYTSYRDIYYSE